MPANSQYDVFVEKLKEAEVVHGRPGDYPAVFTALDMPIPERPKLFLETLVSTGELVVYPEDDDLLADPRAGVKTPCLAYRLKPKTR